MDLSDYRCFEHLAQSLHFARSARGLGMSASALTRRIKAMEEQVGQALVLREPRGVRLTPAGQRFRTFARHQLDQWEEFQNGLRAEAESPVGKLHIACTVTACHTVLPQLLGTFRAQYPGVTLRLITQDATRSLHQLEAGDVDLAVIPTDGAVAEPYSSIPLARTELTWITAVEPSSFDPALSETPLDWANVPLVAPIFGLERSRLDGWFHERSIQPHIVAEVRGNEGIIAMVSLGSGVALVPQLVLDSSPLKSRVRALDLDVPAPYQVSLCCRTRNLTQRVVQLFWHMAQARGAAHPEQ